MCIIADKYDITPLQTIAISLSKEAANGNIINDDKEGFCKALKRAYDADEATEEIREYMVDLMINNCVMSSMTSNQPASELEILMREYGDLATDVAKALYPRTLENGEKRVSCPNCTHVVICALSAADQEYYRFCSNCGCGRLGSDWCQFFTD